MSRIYKTAFAATGDIEVLADTDPGTGKVSLPSGWTSDYEKEDEDPNYRPVGRKEMNGILNEVTGSLGEMQLYGFAPWQAITGGWPVGARVAQANYPGFWFNTVDNNTANPDTDGTGWIAGSGMLVLPTTPSLKLTNTIYVEDRERILRWKTYGDFTGYVDPCVGCFEWGTQPSVRPWQADLNGQTLDRADPKNKALYWWAKVTGRFVEPEVWAPKRYVFCEMGGTLFRVPDIRDQFIRATGTDLDTAIARSLGSSQLDALQKITGGFSAVDGTSTFQLGSGAFFGTSLGTMNTISPSGSTVPDRPSGMAFDSSNVSRASTETRGSNTAFNPVITL